MTIRYTRVLSLAVLAFTILTANPRGSGAALVRMVIESRAPFADGDEFGGVGAYELLTGSLYFEVDPEHDANRRIVDLQYAPRNDRGRVEFASEFELLKPVDLDRGNHRLLYDVLNRGNKTLMGAMNGAWGNTLRPGNGFLMKRGYSILWSGWNWDVRDEHGWLQFTTPTASGPDGETIEQFVMAEMVNSTGTEALTAMEITWTNCRTYPPIDYDDNSSATLTVREAPRGPTAIVPNDQWSFVVFQDSEGNDGASGIAYEAGFEPGHIYELIYRVENPPILGLGFAAVRDALSFFHYSLTDREGHANPLLRGTGEDRRPDPEKVYVYGSSQSGRFVAQMLWQGFHVDEADRMIFEGARIHIAGGGKGGFNQRFGQTSQHMLDLEGNFMPSDYPPFNYLPETDSGSGGANDLLALPKARGKVPKIIITNNDYEYWSRSASLIHTDLEGARDVPLHENVRLYVYSGAGHRAAFREEQGVSRHPLNRLDVHRSNRALLVVLDEWVGSGVEPPASRYPRISNGELVSAAQHRAMFPRIPDLYHPGRNFQPPRMDYGPRFWSEGVMTEIPPIASDPYVALVPACDVDGNSLGGIRLPEVQVPLGTYQGWNPRNPQFGNPDYMVRFEGSFWPFPVSEAERRITHDPRRSIAARYPTRGIYLQELEAACMQLVQQRFLLPESVEEYLAAARQLGWPP